MSIHQPRYSIFKTFDTISLLSVGEFVYQGPAEKAIKYFEEIGNVLSPRIELIVRVSHVDNESIFLVLAIFMCFFKKTNMFIVKKQFSIEYRK